MSDLFGTVAKEHLLWASFLKNRATLKKSVFYEKVHFRSPVHFRFNDTIIGPRRKDI
jgi:hypothetical protein